MYPWRRDEVETVDRASAEVADEAECEETEEKVRSGDEYEEIAGVAGTEGEGEMDRTGGEVTSASRGCGSSMAGESRGALAAAGQGSRSAWNVRRGRLTGMCLLGPRCRYISRGVRVDEGEEDPTRTKKPVAWSHGQRRDRGHGGLMRRERSTGENLLWAKQEKGLRVTRARYADSTLQALCYL